MKTLGERIRIERAKRQQTLANLSQGTGLSKSYLSQLERNLTQPSVTSIKKIARHLGISVVKLFEEWTEDSRNGWGYPHPVTQKTEYSRTISVIRSNRRKGVTLPGSSNVIYEILTPDLNRQLEVMYMRIRKGDTSGDEPMIDPPGEKVGLVLSGTIEVTVGMDDYILEERDSICFPQDIPHSWRGIDGDPIEVIWVMTPPCF